MNDVFSLQRFWNLTREHWARNWRTVVTMMAVLVVVIAVFLIMGETSQSYIKQHYNLVQESRFISILLCLMAFSSLVWFYNLHTNSSKIKYLMLPVSALEQALHSLIWNVLVLILIYLILFYLINLPIYKWAVKYEKALYDLPNNYNHFYPFEVPSILNPFLLLKQKYIQFILFAQVVILVCTLIFKKWAIVKTILLGLVFLLGFVYFMNRTHSISIFNQDWTRLGESKMIKNLNNEFGEYLIVESPEWLNTWHSFSAITVVLIFWIALYYLLKEKEV